VAIFEMTAWQLAEQLQARQITAEEAVQVCYERIDAVDARIKAFLTLTPEAALEQAQTIDKARAAGEQLSSTAGIPIAHKDLLATDGVRTTCASRMLENFTPAYDATVVERCRDAGMIMLGKTNMDQFAMGSATDSSAFGATANPWDVTRVPSGSSGGSAAAVASGEVFMATGSDTGGSIRQPAAFCALVGVKPTYGRVSRYGAVALTSTMDHLGPLCKDVRDAALMMNVISGRDPRDATSADVPVPDYSTALGQELEGLRGGIARELLYGEGVDPEVRQTIKKAIEQLATLGVEILEVNLPHSEYSEACYNILGAAEASSNLARFDGVRYGYRTENQVNDIHELFAKSRTESLGQQVKLRLMRGTYTLSAENYNTFYLKAAKVRTLIKHDFEVAFEQCDFLISSTSPTLPFKVGEKIDDAAVLRADARCAASANLAGIPAISVPCGFVKGLPVGMQLMGKPFDESLLLQVAYAYEQSTHWHKQRAEL
jgi:aspartyl-tRNA(Asn)/glutamyl-tRNA(Gln) amidotransferase subunit A